MSHHDSTDSSSSETQGACADAGERPCVACGYDLRGLGEEPRCPECGLLNIPSALRKQVWEAVDARTWFFSNFFNPFAKRLPGWWWALDRPGDLKRSFKFAGACMLVMCTLTLGGVLLSDAVKVRKLLSVTHFRGEDPNGAILSSEVSFVGFGVLGSFVVGEETVDWDELDQRLCSIKGFYRTRRWYTVVRRPSIASVEYAAWGCVLGFWMWAAPALIGIWTQIRKGLPAFTRAPRTIIAAANYEAHRLCYFGLAFFGVWMLELLMRLVIMRRSGPLYEVLVPLPFILLVVYGALGWIGPLRSDYTRQLIRSRGHAVRIFVMYALFFSFFLTLLTLLPFYYLEIWLKYWGVLER